MKRIIALTALIAATGSFAATTTSTTKVETSDKSLKERIGVWYYGEIDTDRVSDSDSIKGDKKTDFVNYLNISYELSSKTKANLTLRNNITDRQASNGSGDRYEELDPRVSIGTTLMKNDKSSLSAKMTAELPMSRYSNYKHGDKRITRLKPSMTYSTKIDDFNSLMVFGGFNKTMYNESSKSVDSTSRHYLTSWISYTNSSLSEKYKFRIDLEGVMRHQAGTADTNVAASAGEERIISGVNFDIAGIDIFAYAQHDPSIIKAANMLGAGVQIFKSF
ncbi:MAG: hypothetical protein ACJAS4_003420 [Bacteriovoracaceae bacterium]|jgi:hypothetical protein